MKRKDFLAISGLGFLAGFFLKPTKSEIRKRKFFLVKPKGLIPVKYKDIQISDLVRVYDPYADEFVGDVWKISGRTCNGSLIAEEIKTT